MRRTGIRGAGRAEAHAPEAISEDRMYSECNRAEKYKRVLIFPGKASTDDHSPPPACCTEATLCGSFLSSDGPCTLYTRRGCPLRHQDRYRLVTDPATATRTPGPAAMFSSNTDDWHTPPAIIEAVRDLFDGRIDLDSCSNSREAPNVPALEHFARVGDGLSRPWFGTVAGGSGTGGGA